MVIVKIMGGLGNQLFCYAFARALAEEKKDKLFLDLSWIEEMEKSKKIDLNGLKYFKIESNPIEFQKIKFMKIFHNPLINNRIISKILREYFKRFSDNSKSKILFEKSFDFDKTVFMNKNEDLYIREGYWQSYKYFDKYEDIIRKEFEFKVEAELELGNFLDKLKEDKNSVSLHIRRGDYVSNPKLANIYGNICTDSYYESAIEYISKEINKPNFYVFSDDITWAKEFLKDKDNMNFIDINNIKVTKEIGHQDKGYLDLILMSHCRNNIIANSSFSWWGAWLNNNSKKIVIAPQKWLSNFDGKDLIPESWVRI